MRINKITAASFQGVTPVIMKKGSSIRDLEQILEKRAKNSYYLQDATYLYEFPYGVSDAKGTLRKAVKKGHEVGLLVTGNDYSNMLCLKEGWFAHEFAPSRHINRAPVEITTKSNKKIKILLNRINRYI